MNRIALFCTLLGAAAMAQAPLKRPNADTTPHAHVYDVCVYGATAAGVVAAVQARRLGYTAVIVEPGRHLGGLSSGGLGMTDTGQRGAIGGLSAEFYAAVKQHYLDTYGADSDQLRACSDGFRFEPHVAELIFERWVKEHRVEVIRERWLLEVRMLGRRIRELVFERGLRIRARIYVDATYEGDLLGGAGVSYTVGRESNATYGETLNGAQPGRPFHQFRQAVDPYLDPGNPDSGLLPGVVDDPWPAVGEGDTRVQAYNFRMCLTRDASNQLPFPKPDHYDYLRYELLARYLALGQREGMGSSAAMPNGKTDTNNSGGFSTDNIGMNYDWPEGDRETRARIYQDHLDYQQGLMWFLANDERVPEEYRQAVSEWGLAADEFAETGGWPHQLYIREGRRMVSDYVMTEHDCRSNAVAEDPIGLASYNMDSHHVRRIVRDGESHNEGDVQVGVPKPYPIAYRSIVPARGECTNLMVPVCLSCSHIAYGSIRMEPVFMILAQSAATAAAMAIERGLAVQDVPYDELRPQLEAGGQILDWTGPVRPPAEEVAEIRPDSLPGIVLDDRQARSRGTWLESASSPNRRVGTGYVHDDNTNKGLCSLTFTPTIPVAGRYELRIPYWEHANRASNVPITIEVMGREPITVYLNQKVAAPEGWASVGVYDLPDGTRTTITISNDATDGYVVADGIQLLPR